MNLYESGSTPFDYTYAVMNTTTTTGRISSIGTQRDPAFFTQFACDATGQTPPVTAGQRISWTLAGSRDTNSNSNANGNAERFTNAKLRPRKLDGRSQLPV